MQELIERIEKEFDAMGYPLVVDLKPFLKKEKEQIMKAYREGDTEQEWGSFNPEEYYNMTYNKKAK